MSDDDGIAPSPSRLDAFSDGVIAIAATLLGFELRVPTGDGRPLATLLLEGWPSYLAYAVTFLTIAVIWVNHHHAFAAFRRIDATVLWANVALLALVVAVPFANSLLARYLGTPEAATASLVYGLVLAAATVPWIVIWWHTRGRPELLHPGAPEGLATVNLRRSVGGTVAYLVAAALAVVTPLGATLAYLGLAVAFAVTAARGSSGTTA